MEKKMRLLFICMVIIGICCPSASPADTYKYRTSDGVYCFTDDLGKIPKKYRLRAELEEGSSANITTAIAIDTESKTNRGPSKRSGATKRKPFDGTVMLHVRDHCPFGEKAELYLKKIGAKYQRQDYKDNNPIFKVGDGRYGSVVVIVGSQTVRGFSEGAIHQAIEQGGI